MSRVLPNVVLLLPMLTFLAGCGGAEEAPPPPQIRPVKLYLVEGTGGAAVREFPGAINATQRAELSFRVGGVLQEILVREGEDVKQGQLLAKLDPTDFQLRVNDRQAVYDNQRKNFERAEELIVDGNISKQDYDQVEANFRSAEADLELAKQELAYTDLRAPFVGSIGRRDVDNFEEVQAKQTIFQIQNVGLLDVAIDVPENLVRSLRRVSQRADSTEPEERMVTATAKFRGKPDNFDLKFKEVATQADSSTQTFRLTFTMPQPEAFTVLPGMTAGVTLDLSKVVDTDSIKWVRASAVVADSELDARVWVRDDQNMTVSPLDVKIARLSGTNIEVTEGLEGGEEIVSVGAAYLAEGMKVSRMILTEQAVPRPDDPS